MSKDILFRLALSVGLVIVLAGCRGAAPAEETTTPTEALSWSNIGPVDLGGVAHFEKADCMFPEREGVMREQLKVQCGYLIVPEERGKADSPKLRLAAAIYQSSSENRKPDPMVILAGGNGPFLQYSRFFTYIFRQVYEDRDIIVLESRGTGYSEPDLSCKGLNQLYYDALTQDPYSPEIRDRAVELRKGCRQAWEANGVHISAYTTAVGAEDLEALRQALGYPQWNIFANGPESRLAFELARKYPQSVRSVTFDNVIPPQVKYIAESAANAQRGLNLLFQHCAEDTRCQEAFPKLENVFYEVVDQLNASPVTIKFTDLNEGRRLEILMTGDRLIDVILMALNMPYDERLLPEVPRAIYQMENGKTEAMKIILEYVIPNSAPRDTGKPDLIMCNEEVFLTTGQEFQNGINHLPEQLATYANRQMDAYREACEPLRFDQPLQGTKDTVTRSIPALFLNGDFSLYTPPAWAELGAQSFSPNYRVDFNSTGIYVTFSDYTRECSAIIVSSFLNNPGERPDTTCVPATKINYIWITLP